VIKTNADVKALTYCDLQYIGLRGLCEVLQLYPEYASKFTVDIHQDLTFNLREGSEMEGLCRYSRSPRLSQAPQPRPENGATPEKPLPSILEDEEEPDEVFQYSPTTITHRKLLLPQLSSPAPRGSLSSLLGDELCQISALRRNCRSPARCNRGRSPSPQCRRDARLPEREGSVGKRLPKLLIPSLHANGPPDLSPRVVDGIEDNGETSEPQAFSFNVDPLLQSTARDSPTSGTARRGALALGMGHSGSPWPPPVSSPAGTDTSSPALVLEAEEIKQNIRRLNQEVNHLNQEVSHLSQELQNMMELLQSHLGAPQPPT
ncbi:KCNH4 protein, partial [Geococcyx californianus]|nr:KCNH4 protein [Geococcyx californianus]